MDEKVPSAQYGVASAHSGGLTSRLLSAGHRTVYEYVGVVVGVVAVGIVHGGAFPVFHVPPAATHARCISSWLIVGDVVGVWVVVSADARHGVADDGVWPTAQTGVAFAQSVVVTHSLLREGQIT